MNALLVIAGAALKEALRDRILTLAGGFALLMPILSLLLGDLVPGHELRLVIDFGLGAIDALLVLLALMLGSRLVARDLDMRIVYTLLSKPVTRTAYLVGRFLGAAAALWLLLAVLGAVFYAMLFVTTQAAPPIFLGALVLFGVEAMVILALTLLFSLVTAPMLAVIYVMALFLIGQNLQLIRDFGLKEGGVYELFAQLAYHLLPNLETFNLKNQVIYGETLPLGQWLWALGYGASLLVLLLTFSALALRAKELP